MNYRLYRLNFHTAVHFGDGGLMRGRFTLKADTLFSALYMEALKSDEGTADRLLRACGEGRLLISDLLPVIGEDYYIPKPFFRIRTDAANDSEIKKAAKNTTYISAARLRTFLEGMLDMTGELRAFTSGIGHFSLSEKVSMIAGEPMPYGLEIFTFGKESGLFLIIGYDDESDAELLVDMLEALSYTGIGGKISSGYGRFSIDYDVRCKEITTLLTDTAMYHMLLSVALPKDTETERVITDANTKLIKRSGYIASAVGTSRKRDLFMFDAGSVFINRFAGDVFDVAPQNWPHPVFRYGKGMWMGLPV